MTLKHLSDEHILVKFYFIKSLHLWTPIILSLYALFFLPFPGFKVHILNALIVYFTVCIGHCVGLHRHIIHESFKAPKFMKPLFLLFSSLSGIGGPLTWVKVHALRDHWQNQKKAPQALTYDNSLFYDFFINLHCRIYPKKSEHLKRLPKGLLQDFWVHFFEGFWIPLNLFVFFILWEFSNLETAIWLVALRVSVAIVGHWLVGYIVHKWGYISYEIDEAYEEGRNSLILGWLTFGEAYHNNHHMFPESAAMGLKKSEFDLSYCSIKALEILKLAKDVRVSEEHFSRNPTCT